MMNSIGLFLVGFALNTYAQAVSQIYFQDLTVTPNCGVATRFADFVFQAPYTATYTFDTQNSATSCPDTVLLLPSNKAVCNDDISNSNIRSSLTVTLAAGSSTYFYVGSYKDTCPYGSSVSLRLVSYVIAGTSTSNTPTRRPTTKYPTRRPTTKFPTTSKTPTVSNPPTFSISPTAAPVSASPTTKAPTTPSPTIATNAPVTKSPTTKSPTLAPVVTPSSYKIEIAFSSTMQDKYKAAFTNAANRWQEIITGDLPLAFTLSNSNLASCFEFDPQYPTSYTIDDMLIGADVTPIDGQYGILAQAGYCWTDQAGFPRVGGMQFDSADADMLINAGTWESVIMHEMGHVLGIGTRWGAKGLISAANAEPYCVYCYLGANGNIGNGLVGRPAGQKAIIEDQGGTGTARAHWKETVYDRELMTGYAESSGAMPISALTVYSLKDLGYTVDVSKADAFSVSGRRLREKKERKFNYEDHVVWKKPKVGRGSPKPNREQEAEDLIIRNGGQARIPVEVSFDDSI